MRRSYVLAFAGIAVFLGAIWLVATLSSEPTASAPGDAVVISKSEKVEPRPAKIEPLLAKVETVLENDSRLSQMQAQMEGLRQQLEAQQREIARLRQNTKVNDRPVEGGGKADESGKAGQVSEEEQALAEHKRQETRLSELERQFASQSQDPAWSRTAEDQIAAAVGQVSKASDKEIGERPQLGNAICRTNLCRFTATHKDEVSAERFMQEFPNRLSWRNTHGRVQLVHNSDGSVSTVVYLSREGRPLYENQQPPKVGPEHSGNRDD